MLDLRSGAIMTPKEAGRVVRSWPMLYDSGILGHIGIQQPQVETSGLLVKDFSGSFSAVRDCSPERPMALILGVRE